MCNILFLSNGPDTKWNSAIRALKIYKVRSSHFSFVHGKDLVCVSATHYFFFIYALILLFHPAVRLHSLLACGSFLSFKANR